MLPEVVAREVGGQDLIVQVVQLSGEGAGMMARTIGVVMLAAVDGAGAVTGRFDTLSAAAGRVEGQQQQPAARAIRGADGAGGRHASDSRLHTRRD